MRGQKHRSWNYSMNNFFLLDKQNTCNFVSTCRSIVLDAFYLFILNLETPTWNHIKWKQNRKNLLNSAYRFSFVAIWYNLDMWRFKYKIDRNVLIEIWNWSNYFDRKCDRKSTRKQARMKHKTISHTVFETTTTTTSTTL